MTGTLTVVMLAGTIRQSPLRERLDVPVLCLPMGWRGTLLDTWLDALGTLSERPDVTIVLNTQSDVEAVSAAAREGGHPSRDGWSLRPIAEPAAWRGAAGLLRDMTEHVDAAGKILVVEAAGLPPRTLAPIAAALGGFDDGFVGVCGVDQPAGVYGFTRGAVESIPLVGYYDLKEQFLPALFGEDKVVRPVTLGERILRIHDRHAYLEAVRVTMAAAGDAPGPRISDRASVSGSAVVQGASIVESGAVVEDGAVVHESVVLAGATIGGGAIVSRSVVGPLVSVPPRSKIMHEVRGSSSGRTATAARRPPRRTGRGART